MTTQSFTTAFLVEQGPEEVFSAIADVRSWWSGEIEGVTDELDAEFTYRHRDLHYTKQRITEFVPGKRIVWRVLYAYLSFVDDPSEWMGTEIVFDLARRGDRTEVRFTHRGLVPSHQCYDKCAGAWSFYINDSLRQSITTGRVAGGPGSPVSSGGRS